MSHRIIVMNSGLVVEHGTTDRIINSPSHPYTKTLMAAAFEHQGEHVISENK